MSINDTIIPDAVPESGTATKKPVKRAGILFFYDGEGIVDRYVDTLLSGMIQVLTDLVVVVNGVLTPDGRDLFSKYTPDILVRKNEGLDVWAYKTALEYVGWEKLEEYDEVVLFNHTIMGPVYPISEMFDIMAKKPDLDFWGATKHLGMSKDPFGFCEYGYIPEHIQSSFMVYRQKFVRTRELQTFWRDIPEIHGYNESVAFYESYFTKHFADMGFRWDCYVNNSEDSDLTNYLLISDPRRALEKYRSPFFKRRSFFQDGDYYYAFTGGETAKELFDFLKNKTDYDTNLILENLIRTAHQTDMVRTMGLNYVLPSEVILSKKEEKESCALFVRVCQEKELLRTLGYVRSMPEWGDIYIAVASDKLAQMVKALFGVLRNKLEICVSGPEEKDAESLLVTFREQIRKYDLVCFYHDKRDNGHEPGSIDSSLEYLLSESVLHSENYVRNILNLFRENPYLGLLSPVPACHSYYFPGYAQDWGDTYEPTRKWMEQLNIRAPIAENVPPVAPLGMVFWFRTAAMGKLLQREWKHSDFSAVQGNEALHEVAERILPYVAQDAGFYSGYVMPEFLASIRMNMMGYYLRTFGKIVNEYDLNGYGMVISARDQMTAALAQSPINAGRQLGTVLDGSPAPYGCKEALAIAIHNRIPFLFRKTAERYPAAVRTIGFKAAFAIWRIKRIMRRNGLNRIVEADR